MMTFGFDAYVEFRDLFEERVHSTLNDIVGCVAIR